MRGLLLIDGVLGLHLKNLVYRHCFLLNELRHLPFHSCVRHRDVGLNDACHFDRGSLRFRIECALLLLSEDLGGEVESDCDIRGGCEENRDPVARACIGIGYCHDVASGS